MKKKNLEGNFYAIAHAILEPHINMGPARTTDGQPLRELPLPKEIQQLREPEYWKSVPPHPEYGNIYYPWHCYHEGILFTVRDGSGNPYGAGEHMGFPNARALAKKLNEGEEQK